MYTHLDQLFNVSYLQGEGMTLSKAAPFILEKSPERFSAANTPLRCVNGCHTLAGESASHTTIATTYFHNNNKIVFGRDVHESQYTEQVEE